MLLKIFNKCFPLYHFIFEDKDAILSPFNAEIGTNLGLIKFLSFSNKEI